MEVDLLDHSSRTHQHIVQCFRKHRTGQGAAAVCHQACPCIEDWFSVLLMAMRRVIQLWDVQCTACIGRNMCIQCHINLLALIASFCYSMRHCVCSLPSRSIASFNMAQMQFSHYTGQKQGSRTVHRKKSTACRTKRALQACLRFCYHCALSSLQLS